MTQVSWAFLTEVGVSYGRKKTTFDEFNYIDSETSTGSISFFFAERLATEFSYTKAVGIRVEKASTTDSRRTIVQKTEVTGLDLILMLSDRKAFVQPYIKAGVAQLVRKQSIDIEGYGVQELTPETAYAPSYGLGIKIGISASMNIKLSYDIWQTPIGGNLKTDDSSLRAGLSWYL